MFGIDQALAHLSGGAGLLLVLGISLVLGLRHASDPDHLAAVTTLAAGTEVPVRRAARLGFAWGAGHATSLFVLGLPIVLWRAFLPGPVRQATEMAVGLLIVALAAWLLARWLHGTLTTRASVRSNTTAYGIGLVHGAGGSAAICLLLLGSIPGRGAALAALAIFSFGTCLSMTLLSAGFGRMLGGRGALRAAPVLGAASLAFGLWYLLAAANLV